MGPASISRCVQCYCWLGGGGGDQDHSTKDPCCRWYTQRLVEEGGLTPNQMHQQRFVQHPRHTTLGGRRGSIVCRSMENYVAQGIRKERNPKRFRFAILYFPNGTKRRQTCATPGFCVEMKPFAMNEKGTRDVRLYCTGCMPIAPQVCAQARGG